MATLAEILPLTEFEAWAAFVWYLGVSLWAAVQIIQPML